MIPLPEVDTINCFFVILEIVCVWVCVLEIEVPFSSFLHK